MSKFEYRASCRCFDDWFLFLLRRSGKGLKKRNALRNLQARWTNAVVPYSLAGGFSEFETKAIGHRKANIELRNSINILEELEYPFHDILALTLTEMLVYINKHIRL